MFGLLSLVRNHRHPLPFAIGFTLMAAVEWMKFNTYAAPMFNAWEPNRVSLLYFVACVAGALLNLFDSMFIPATTYRERNPTLQEMVQTVTSKTNNLKHAAERAAESVRHTAETVKHSAESAMATIKGKEELHDEWNERADLQQDEASGYAQDEGEEEQEPDRVAALERTEKAGNGKHKGKKHRQKQHKTMMHEEEIAGKAKVQ